MVGQTASKRALIITLSFLVAAALFPATTMAVTKSQVDEACADSRAQLAEYREAQADFETAAIAYEGALNDVARVEAKQDRIQGSVEANEEDLLVIQDKIEEQAVQLYMMGGSANPGIILSASSVDKFLTTSQFLNAATVGGQESIDDLIAARGELDGLQVTLDETRTELKQVEAEKQDAMNAQQEAMEREQAAYAKLTGRCKELTARYEAEQAEARARAAQRASGSIQVGSFICPMTRGRTSFIDSWGFPRSGGRTHKGTDMMAAYGEPVYAVQDGRVRLSTSSLGGKSVYLYANTGFRYYYAHLSGWNVSSGATVSQGTTVGFNGDTGNAQAGAPHVHFEIHPPGRGAVNPYPTLVAACR
ncbi:MAG: murein hydrolase activator EnvC family protein [Acidimicrobiia bacterium]